MEIRVRRATVDDLDSLRKLWAPIGFDVANLEKRVTEFQVAETAEGVFLGAVGFLLIGNQAMVHHEALADATNSSEIRSAFWKRLQVVASNHGAFRVWVRENAAHWDPFGFKEATPEALEKLPEFWDRSASGWMTLQLKDDSAVTKMEQEMAMILATEKQRTAKIVEGAKVFRKVATIIGFLLAFLLFGAALWVYLSRQAGGMPQR